MQLQKMLPKIELDYRPSRIHLIYNGHAIQENQNPGSFRMENGKRFKLQQFHFHSPSEHTFDGKHFPMELHLVHEADDATVGVIAMFIKQGARNPVFDPIWSHLSDADRPIRTANVTIDTLALMPKNLDYYIYDGSSTTPPCTEKVKWIVLETPVTMSKEQIDRFRTVIHRNNRPVQPLNGRLVLQTD